MLTLCYGNVKVGESRLSFQIYRDLQSEFGTFVGKTVWDCTLRNIYDIILKADKWEIITLSPGDLFVAEELFDLFVHASRKDNVALTSASCMKRDRLWKIESCLGKQWVSFYLMYSVCIRRVGATEYYSERGTWNDICPHMQFNVISNRLGQRKMLVKLQNTFFEDCPKASRKSNIPVLFCWGKRKGNWEKNYRSN